MGKQPKYVIKFVNDAYNGLYYSRDITWGGAPRENASELSHADAVRIANKLGSHNMGADCVVEPAVLMPVKEKKKRGNTPQRRIDE